MKQLFIFLILSGVLLAKDKDKPEAPPQLTTEQKLELTTAERDYLFAKTQAIPYDIASEQARNAMLSKQDEILKALGVDQSKWIFDLQTFQFNPAPPRPEPPKPAK